MDTLLWYVEIALDYGFQMLPCVLVAALVFFCLIPWRKRRLTRRGLVSGSLREGALLLFVVFTMGLAALTLSPPGFWYQLLYGYPITFQFGLNHGFFWQITIIQDLLQMGSWSFFMLLGNLCMFAPLGFFPALLWSAPRWWKSALIGFCASAFVEVFQLFLPRSSDINEIILNTFGALCGFWLYLLLRRLAPRAAAKFKCRQLEVPDGRNTGDTAAPA